MARASHSVTFATLALCLTAVCASCRSRSEPVPDSGSPVSLDASAWRACPPFEPLEGARALADRGSDAAAATARVQRWVEDLASEELAGRRAGSAGARRAAGWIAWAFADSRLEPPLAHAVEGPAFCQRFPAGLFPEPDMDDTNVVGRRRGSAAFENERPWILVGAHFDAMGVNVAGRHFPGADDNASGIAALTELARRTRASPASGDIVFVAFGAEETSRLGSRRLAEEIDTARVFADLGPLVAMINLDMVGRVTDSVPTNALGFRLGGPDGPGGNAPRRLARALHEVAEGLGLSLVDLDAVESETAESETGESPNGESPNGESPNGESTEVASGKSTFGDGMSGQGNFSDDESFKHRAPTVLLTTGLHDDRHTQRDTTAQIDYDQIMNTVVFVQRLLDELWEAPELNPSRPPR